MVSRPLCLEVWNHTAQYSSCSLHVAVEHLKWELGCAVSIKYTPGCEGSMAWVAAAGCHTSFVPGFNGKATTSLGNPTSAMQNDSFSSLGHGNP